MNSTALDKDLFHDYHQLHPSDITQLYISILN